ncbi:MAG: hypothetical protein QXK13_07000 [Fervidicoccaceae archaeon]
MQTGQPFQVTIPPGKTATLPAHFGYVWIQFYDPDPVLRTYMPLTLIRPKPGQIITITNNMITGVPTIPSTTSS